MKSRPHFCLCVHLCLLHRTVECNNPMKSIVHCNNLAKLFFSFNKTLSPQRTKTKSLDLKIYVLLLICWPKFSFWSSFCIYFSFCLTFVSLQLAAGWAGQTYLTSDRCARRSEEWAHVFTLRVSRAWWGQYLYFYLNFNYLNQEGKEVFKPVGRAGLCLDPRFPKNLQQLAHFCNCLTNCAPIYYKHLLERAWFVNFLTDS